MSDGFFQLQLDEASSNLCTFHSPFGRYRFNRMPFGLSSAPEIFQKITSQLFGEISGVTVYFDDLIIAANDAEEHDKILQKVLDRAREYNIKFNRNKIQYRVKEVRYLGQIFSSEGMRPDAEDVEAITNLKEPKDKKQLQSILGMVNYLGKYIPQLAKITAPLRELLKKDVLWEWKEAQNKALGEIKSRLANAPTLKCYRRDSKLTIQTDASKDGLGCCLLMDGHPISFASRSLTLSEQNYAQIEKELLSICFACKKFHSYIYGRRITVNTDHKPLETILTKEIGKISQRLQRMCLSLLRYDLEVKYLPGRYMYIADLLSRNYLKTTNVEQDPIFMDKVHTIEKVLPITKEKLSKFQTENDEELKVIKQNCIAGWPKTIKSLPINCRWAWKLRDKLHLKQNIIMLDEKIVVPKILQNEMLKLLHTSHFGITKTKKRSRQLMYWRGMSTDIETMISKCKVCEKFLVANTKEKIVQREIPKYPFEVLGTDICSFGGSDYLVIACCRTKWLDILPLKTKTATEMIEKIKVFAANHGIPRVLISDNMPFASLEFRKFANEWGIEQALTSPHYPKSNGFAERMVGIAKTILKKNRISGNELQSTLLEYRSNPIDGMTYSPAQLALARNLRTKLPISTALLEPKICENVESQLMKNRDRQKHYYNMHTRNAKSLEEGDSILMRGRQGWEPAQVKSKHKSPRSYIVTNSEGRDYRRNRIDLRISRNPPPVYKEPEDLEDLPVKEHKSEVVIRSPIPKTGPYVTKFGRTIYRPARFNDYVPR